jgi:ankyrin repeat protein
MNSKEVLIDAIIHNDVKKVKQLLEQGVDPNSTLDKAHITPLHYAAQNDAREIAQLLFTAGATLESQTDEGQTPLDIAKECHHPEMVKLLLRLKNQMFGIMDAEKDKQ